MIAAYLEWCSLLGLQVTKVQVWSTQRPGQHIAVGDKDIATSPTFRIVGIVLATSDSLASAAHFTPRLDKAITTARRLESLDLPASIKTLLWRTTVLSQALYGSELRTLRPGKLTSLAAFWPSFDQHDPSNASKCLARP